MWFRLAGYDYLADHRMIGCHYRSPCALGLYIFWADRLPAVEKCCLDFKNRLAVRLEYVRQCSFSSWPEFMSAPSIIIDQTIGYICRIGEIDGYFERGVPEVANCLLRHRVFVRETRNASLFSFFSLLCERAKPRSPADFSELGA